MYKQFKSIKDSDDKSIGFHRDIDIPEEKFTENKRIKGILPVRN